MKKDFVFVSESVTAGHPDKLCDQISDAVVDHFLQQDPYSGIIVECGVATAIVFIAARFASQAVVDIPKLVRQVIANVGYDQPDFNAKTCSVVTSLKELPIEEREAFDVGTVVGHQQIVVAGKQLIGERPKQLRIAV